MHRNFGVISWQVGGRCWLRSDSVWAPNTTDADPEMLVSGRPWHNDGDNPAPYLDPVTGEVTVLYRCDSEAGLGGYKVASLIGAMRAPSWAGYGTTPAPQNWLPYTIDPDILGTQHF